MLEEVYEFELNNGKKYDTTNEKIILSLPSLLEKLEKVQLYLPVITYQ